MSAGALYEGSTRHRRFSPKAHEFRFRLYLALLDHGVEGTEEVVSGEDVRFGGPLWPAIRFARSDYLDGDVTTPLGDAVRNLVAHRTGRAPSGRVLTLTQLRTNGYVFNPITVHYCLSEVEDEHGGPIEVVVLEVTNTPWNERHTYVIDARAGAHEDASKSVSIAETDERGRIRSHFPKAMHVSPFMSMDVTYRFTATTPDSRLWLRLENLEQRNGVVEKIFDADLSLRRRPLDHRSLGYSARRHPFQTIRVWSAIHVHALYLALKRVPFVRHPGQP